MNEAFHQQMSREQIWKSQGRYAVVVEEAEEIEETIGIEKNPAEDLEIQDISILESTVEEVTVMEPVIERPVTMKERAKEISSVIRNNYGRCKLVGYDVCFRAGVIGYKPVEEIKPDSDTIENIVIMVKRSLAFWKEYGPYYKRWFYF